MFIDSWDMHDEKELVSRILKGDMYAFKVLVNQYERLVFYMVHKLIDEKEDAEDICQEVFLKVYKNLQKFKFESKLSTWIGQIAYSTTINHLKKYHKAKGKTQELDTIENISRSGDDPADTLFKKDTHAFLNEEIKKLPQQYRVVLTLFHINEMSYQEIELITGMPEGTVKSYLFRARKILKDKLSLYLKNELA